MPGRSSHFPTPPGTVRVASLSSIPRVLQKLGFEPASVLAEMGFDMDLLDDPDNIIGYSERGHLLQRCVEKTGCPHFGLLFGQLTGTSAFGFSGFLMQQSPDVATALESFVRYLHLHVRGATVYVAGREESTFIGYSIIETGTEAIEQIQDAAVAVACNIMRKLCGPKWQPIEVSFAHDKPADVRPFRKFFGAPLIFNAEQSGLRFASSWMRKALPEADPALRALLEKQVNQLESRYAQDYAEQVRRVLHSAVLTHHASAGYIARFFSIHERTLHRRLRSCGTSFRELLEDSRCEIARQLLESSSMSIGEIATNLDYSDGSAFARAFRRHCGTTPSAWRDSHRQASP